MTGSGLTNDFSQILFMAPPGSGKSAQRYPMGESGKVSDRVIRALSALMPERRAGPIATTEKS
jgi:hypothetical protein